MISDEQKAHNVEHLRSEVADLTLQVSEMTKVLNELSTAWKTAGIMVGFVKWAAGLASVLFGAWAALQKVKGH